jgi:hypothetical protein
MQRIQALRLLITFGVITLAACGQSTKVPTVSDYLHDIDAAHAILKLAKTDIAKYQIDPSVINASAAIAKYSTSDILKKCWPTKPATTAGTDHACVDEQGFKR